MGKVPGQLLGAVLFAGVGEPEVCWTRSGQLTPTGILTLTPAAGGTVFFWADVGDKHGDEHQGERLRGDGGLPTIATPPLWNKAGGLMKVGPYTMQVYGRSVEPNCSIEIPIEAPW